MSYKNILHEKTLKWSLTLFPLNQVPKISVTSPKHQSVGEGKLERKNNSLWVVIFKKNYFFKFYQKWFLNTLVDSLPKPWKRPMPERYLRQSLIIVWAPVSPGKRCVCGRGKGLAHFFTDSSLLWGMASRAACVLHSYHSCWMAPLFTSPVFSGERGWVLITQATGWQWL